MPWKISKNTHNLLKPFGSFIAAFLTYAVGFIARPLGGIVFGQIGDRLGRKHTLQVTNIMVGVATFLMGCLPGYNSIGYWAPALKETKGTSLREIDAADVRKGCRPRRW